MNPMQGFIAKTFGTAILLGLLTRRRQQRTRSFSAPVIPTPSNEIESADDFVLTSPTSITSATFTGLLTGGVTAANIGQLVVEIYQVFPNLSDVGRTSGPPVFSTPKVPTRVNLPSDVELEDRDSSSGNLTFTTTDKGSFSVANSGLPGCIDPIPNQTTGGNGAVTGGEVELDVTSPHLFRFRPTISSSWRAGRNHQSRGRVFVVIGAEADCAAGYAVFPQVSQTFSHGPATRPWSPIGCGSAAT